jgi:hypothetical protein
VLVHVVGNLAVRCQGSGEDEADVVFDHQIRRPVANFGLEAGERYRSESPQSAVVRGRLSGIAHPELDIVDALDRQKILGLGVGILVDVRAGLIGRALRNVRLDQRVRHLENLRLSAEHTREGRTADVASSGIIRSAVVP